MMLENEGRRARAESAATPAVMDPVGLEIVFSPLVTLLIFITTSARLSMEFSALPGLLLSDFSASSRRWRWWWWGCSSSFIPMLDVEERLLTLLSSSS